MKVLVIPADIKEPFRIVELSVENDDRQLDEMQKLVGGYIQEVPSPTNEIIVWCNEKGMIHRLPTNRRATVLVAALWHAREEAIVGLVGDVFISGGATRDGFMLSVPDAVVKAMEAQQKPPS